MHAVLGLGSVANIVLPSDVAPNVPVLQQGKLKAYICYFKTVFNSLLAVMSDSNVNSNLSCIGAKKSVQSNSRCCVVKKQMPSKVPWGHGMCCSVAKCALNLTFLL